MDHSNHPIPQKLIHHFYALDAGGVALLRERRMRPASDANRVGARHCVDAPALQGQGAVQVLSVDPL